MRDYAKVMCRLWRNTRFRSMSDDGRTVYLYLLTCGHTNKVGLFYLPNMYGAADLQWTTGRFAERLQEPLRNGLLNHDPTVDLVLLKRFLKHDPLPNPNVVQRAVAELNDLPTGSYLHQELADELKGYGLERYQPLITLLETVAYTVPHTVQTTNVEPYAESDPDPDPDPDPRPEPDPDPRPEPEKRKKTVLDHSGESTKKNSTAYTPEFERAWRAYPARAGSNPKRKAFQAWTARVREGNEPADIQAGVERYATYCATTGKLKTEFIQQFATFVGPNKEFRENWDVPEQPPGEYSLQRESERADKILAGWETQT